MYADDLVLCGQMEENLRVMVGCFVEVCRCLKVNEGESKVMVLNAEEGLECEVSVNRVRWGMCQNLNTWDAFWMNQVHMRK